jgi:signal transduction histidine kinase
LCKVEPLYTKKAKGTGLGLNICKQIIEKHDGDITISSAPGKGTIVTIVLPYKNIEEMQQEVS